MGRAARITGTLMIVAGVCSVAWALLVWQWQDPFTAVYTKYQQHKLASTFAHEFADYRPPDAAPETSSQRAREDRPRQDRRGGQGLPARRSTRASRSDE